MATLWLVLAAVFDQLLSQVQSAIIQQRQTLADMSWIKEATTHGWLVE